MIENYNLLLLLGGYSECDRLWWNKASSEVDQCFKLYFPTSGYGRVKVRGQWYEILPNHIYFISGFDLEEQQCDRFIHTYWVHFMPASILLSYILRNAKPFIQWNQTFNCFGEDCGGIFEAIFKKSSREADEQVVKYHITAKSRQTHNYHGQLCKAQSLILYFLSDIISKADIARNMEASITFRRLKKSIDYMKDELLEMPSLEQIAEKSHLSPNYFHRLFTRTFGVTPHLFMVQQRMETAKQLLSTTGMAVKEIAEKAGFSNEFYFSRVFKKQMGVNPSEYRKKKWIP